MRRRRFRSHVIEERFKTLTPGRTDGDATAAVVLEALVVRGVTPLAHAHPRLILRRARLPMARVAVPSIRGRRPHLAEALERRPPNTRPTVTAPTVRHGGPGWRGSLAGHLDCPRTPTGRASGWQDPSRWRRS